MDYFTVFIKYSLVNKHTYFSNLYFSFSLAFSGGSHSKETSDKAANKEQIINHKSSGSNVV